MVKMGLGQPHVGSGPLVAHRGGTLEGAGKNTACLIKLSGAQELFAEKRKRGDLRGRLGSRSQVGACPQQCLRGTRIVAELCSAACPEEPRGG